MPKDLTKVLIKDISCDPANSAVMFMEMSERAALWSQSANQWAQQFPALADAVKDSAKELLQHRAQDGFHFDLYMIEKVGGLLEAQAPAMKMEFSRFVTDVSNHYDGMMNSALSVIDNQPIQQKVKEITSGISSVAHNVETWARGANDVAGAMARLPFPDEVKKVLHDIGTFSADVRNVAGQIGTVMESLWNKTEQSVQGADALSTQAKTLRDQLALPATTADQKVVIGAKLEAIESQLTRKQPELEKTLNTVRAGFQALGIVAKIAGDSKLANDIIAVGEAGITIAQSVATLIAGSAAGGPAAPVIAIVGAVFMLVSNLFGGGQQRDDMILKAIDRLSKHIDDRFDRVELMIQKSVEFLAEHIDRRINALGNHLDKRFDRIEETLNYMYKNLLLEFRRVHEDDRAYQRDQFDSIQRKLEGIKQSIDYLHTDLAQGFVNLYEQTYRDQRDHALTDIARDEISARKHRQYYQTMTRWARENVKSDILAGNDQSDDLVPRILASGISPYINKIRSKAVELGVQDHGRLVNPAAWADSVRTLIQYFAITPELFEHINPRNVIVRDIQAITAEGLRVREFIAAVQTNYPLFETLIKNYKDALLAVLAKAYQLCIKHDNAANPIGTASRDLARALIRVTDIEVADIFISQEIYPTGREIPSLAVPNSISAHPHYDHAYPESKITMGVLQQVEGSTPSDRKFYNDQMRQDFLDSRNGNVRGGYKWVGNPSNPNSPIHDWNAVTTHYEAAYNEAQALRAACEDLSDWIGDSHLASLAGDANYRNRRIAAILGHHAVAERDRALAAGELPHFELLKKYFSIQNLATLNNTLRNNREFTDCLDNLQKAFEELSIFIGFAFPRQFATDPNLRIFLDRLWDKQDILNYIAAGSNKQNFIGLVLQNSFGPHGEMEMLRRFILNLVANAEIAGEMKYEQYGNPVIEKVLKELEIFKQMVSLAISNRATAALPKQVRHHLGSYDEIEHGPNALFAAITYQLRAKEIDIATLAGIVGDETDDEKLSRMAKFLEQEIIVIDEADTETTVIKGYNPSAEKKIHLLHLSANSWQPFNPSLECRARSDYRAAELASIADTFRAQTEELRTQLAYIQSGQGLWSRAETAEPVNPTASSANTQTPVYTPH